MSRIPIQYEKCCEKCQKEWIQTYIRNPPLCDYCMYGLNGIDELQLWLNTIRSQHKYKDIVAVKINSMEGVTTTMWTIQVMVPKVDSNKMEE